MDNFMDKLAQKFTAQEMIKANQTAEAQEMKRLRTQVAEYEAILQEMKKVSQQNMQEIAGMQKLAAESLSCVQKLADENLSRTAQVEAAKAADAELSAKMAKLQETLTGNQESMTELFRQSDDFVHKENVKVYRNVQAVVVEEMKRQSAELAEQNGALIKQTQALLAQTEALVVQTAESRKFVKGLKPLLILTFLAALANVALLVIQILGIL